MFNFHIHGRWTSAVAEGVNTRIQVLERKAYGSRRAVNHQARISSSAPATRLGRGLPEGE